MVFSCLATKLVATVFSGLISKSVATVSSGLASKPVAQVSEFGYQNRQLWFGDLGLKITAMVSSFSPQNQANFGLSVASQNRQREDGVGHTSRSIGLLHLEASYARVSQCDLKTGRGATTSGARRIIAEVASKGC
jgi:hypothetical protein